MKNHTVLFVDACVRKASRTRTLAEELLKTMAGETTRLFLAEEDLQPLTDQTLICREACLQAEDYDAPPLRYARQFAAADEIVIAAPYWDLSFPSVLKTYFEHVCTIGLTFSYDANGEPFSLCRAKRLFYVMTAGGPVLPPNHGYAYVRDLAATFFGIKDVRLVCAEHLDDGTVDPASALRQARRQIRESTASLNTT